jgi:hypothetical protein
VALEGAKSYANFEIFYSQRQNILKNKNPKMFQKN